MLRLRPTDFVGCVFRCGGTWGIPKCLRCYGLVAALACANWLVYESVCVNRLVRADWYGTDWRTGLMEPSCFFCALKRFRRAALLKWS